MPTVKSANVERIYNFSSGPATMPLPVLERAREELLSTSGTGMSVMEMSHRSKHFSEILSGAERGLRELLSVPENFKAEPLCSFRWYR